MSMNYLIYLGYNIDEKKKKRNTTFASFQKGKS